MNPEATAPVVLPDKAFNGLSDAAARVVVQPNPSIAKPEDDKFAQAPVIAKYRNYYFNVIIIYVWDLSSHSGKMLVEGVRGSTYVEPAWC